MPPAAASPTVRARSLTSAAYLFPVKGILYFARHPFLYPVIKARLVPCFVLSAAVLATLFFWTYLPQVAFLAPFHMKGGAWINATTLVLGEGAAITHLLFEAFFADESLVDVFDAVLVAQSLDGLVETSRPVDRDAPDALKSLGKPHTSSVYSPFSIRQIIELILLLPLNLVPWVGVPLFLWLTGYRAGPLQHHRYFKLKGFTGKQKKDYVRKRRLKYTTFGCVHLVLQLVPVLSMLFLFTSAAGSALLAAKMQEEDEGEPVPNEPPPDYTDEV